MAKPFSFICYVLTIIFLIKIFCQVENHLFQPSFAFAQYGSALPVKSVSAVFFSYQKDMKRSTNSDSRSGKELIVRINISPSSRVKSSQKYVVVSDVFDPQRQTTDQAMVPYLFEVFRGEPIVTYPLIFIKDAKFGNDFHEDFNKQAEEDLEKLIQSNEVISSALKDKRLQKIQDEESPDPSLKKRRSYATGNPVSPECHNARIRRKRNAHYFDDKPSKNFESPQNWETDDQSCDTCGKGKKQNKAPKIDEPAGGSTLGNGVRRGLDVNSKEYMLQRLAEKHGVAINEICSCNSSPQYPCMCRALRPARSRYDTSTWFSVFNISEPQPFVTTQIRIFRKRHGSWWKVAPTARLDSNSGAFSDGNISISLSSPMDILQLEKAMRFRDHQILIPKRIVRERRLENRLKRNYGNAFPNIWMLNPTSPSQRTFSNFGNLHSLTDFGFMPFTVNVVDKCPLDGNRLCLNMLSDGSPGVGIKVKMPFQQNMLIHKDGVKIQISNVLTDATTKDVLRVSALLTNYGIQNRMCSVKITNCPTPSVVGAETSIEKLLAPSIGETFTFLLPLIPDSNIKHTRFDCNVVVETEASKRATTEEGKIVALRKLLVEPGKRCICVWTSLCHCIPTLETQVDYHIFQMMSESEKQQAGFAFANVMKCNYCKHPPKPAKKFPKKHKNRFSCLVLVSILLVTITLLLGLAKAVLGSMFCRLNRYAFDYVYGPQSYANSSRFTKFLGNIFLFALLPFRYSCACCTSSADDGCVAISKQQFKQEPVCNAAESDESGGFRIKVHRPEERKPRSITEAKQQELENRLSELSSSYYQELSDAERCESPRRMSARRIVQSLSEQISSRKQSIHKLLSSCSDRLKKGPCIQCVESLLDAKRVYRTFQEPIGNVCQIPFGFKYCVQGYFLPVCGSMYEFVNFQPLVQYRGLSSDGKSVKDLHPPIFLSSSAFNRKYSSEGDVLNSCDLSVEPPPGVPCINTRVATHNESCSDSCS